MHCISPPFRIYVDFMCGTTSDTIEEGIISPSIPTHFNTKDFLQNQDDVDKLLDEISSPDLLETVLYKHHLVRTVDATDSLLTSNVRITKLYCLWAYVYLFDHEPVSFE